MHLKIFMPQGVFEEKNGEQFLMDFVDAEAWMEDQTEITMVSSPMHSMTRAVAIDIPSLRCQLLLLVS